eukprot:gene40848-49824_t
MASLWLIICALCAITSSLATNEWQSSHDSFFNAAAPTNGIDSKLVDPLEGSQSSAALTPEPVSASLFYKGANGEMHGPFHPADMQQWVLEGYLPTTLPVTWQGAGGKFVPLSQLLEKESVASSLPSQGVVSRADQEAMTDERQPRERKRKGRLRLLSGLARKASSWLGSGAMGSYARKSRGGDGALEGAGWEEDNTLLVDMLMQRRGADPEEPHEQEAGGAAAAGGSGMGEDLDVDEDVDGDDAPAAMEVKAEARSEAPVGRDAAGGSFAEVVGVLVQGSAGEPKDSAAQSPAQRAEEATANRSAQQRPRSA